MGPCAAPGQRPRKNCISAVTTRVSVAIGRLSRGLLHDGLFTVTCSSHPARSTLVSRAPAVTRVPPVCGEVQRAGAVPMVGSREACRAAAAFLVFYILPAPRPGSTPRLLYRSVFLYILTVMCDSSITRDLLHTAARVVAIVGTCTNEGVEEVGIMDYGGTGSHCIYIQ